MVRTTVDTIETLLEGVLDRTEGEEVRYKLRTAMQLLDVIREQERATRLALEDADLNEDLQQRLGDLGYLDD